jgi:hypothetical protein
VVVQQHVVVPEFLRGDREPAWRLGITAQLVLGKVTPGLMRMVTDDSFSSG